MSESTTVRRKRPREELPLGTAIVRQMTAQHYILATPPSSINERLNREVASLQEALNAFVLQVALECDIEEASTMIEDAVAADAPTSLELIQKGAATGCCRVVGAESKKVRATTPRRERRSRGKSR